ncbi:MAG: hypothetical protein JNL05_13055 [Flavobacteriales bacterium]|nr:hypothetical protein [Flavobacteriales bacterium]
MKLFLYGEVTPANRRLQTRLSWRGYTTEMIGERPWVGTPSEAHRRQTMVRHLLDCHAVVVPDADMPMQQLLQLLVACEFMKVPVIAERDLPLHAPDAPSELWHYALHVPVRITWAREERIATVGTTPQPTTNTVLDRARRVLQRWEERANRFFGMGLKNPMTRQRSYPEPKGMSTTG